MLVCVFLCTSCTRDRGCSAHPAFPAPSVFKGESYPHLGRIAPRHQLPEMLARVLAGRDVELDAVEDFLDPTIRKLMPDPYTVTQMETAAKRIAEAATRGEKVAIFGDYDVDGATSAALLAWHLRHCGLDPLIHIPDRIFEGYGPNVEAVRSLAGKGATLLVTVDCRTTSPQPPVATH